jgi:hypothetical protein
MHTFSSVHVRPDKYTSRGTEDEMAPFWTMDLGGRKTLKVMRVRVALEA